jgi:hypothetical protein
MKKFIKENWFKLSIVIILSVVSLSIVCYLLIVQLSKQDLSKQQTNNNRQNQEQLTKEQKDQSNDSFQKNIDCAKYKDAILKQEDQYNKSQKPEIRDSDNTGENPDYNLYVENNSLKEIFYSPKVNSCLYVESRKTLMKIGADAKPDVGEWSTVYDTYYLIDELTGKEIDFNKGLPFLQIIHRGERFTSEEEANVILSEYKE